MTGAECCLTPSLSCGSVEARTRSFPRSLALGLQMEIVAPRGRRQDKPTCQVPAHSGAGLFPRALQGQVKGPNGEASYVEIFIEFSLKGPSFSQI